MHLLKYEFVLILLFVIILSCLLFQAIIHFGKVSRKHNLTGVCLQTLSRLYTIPNVPVVDCFHKIRQQVKCYMQMASISSNKHEIQDVYIYINV